ncbi:MAG TPA: FAD-linked oxidase C-terminal domain-containing protein [Bryobacteraceae bacterium]|jgi:glycolate oxidase|nr:FAD-linked oxidase C-terminal domain-containing protein [Bryobacteraceae bacterium]
MSLTEQAISAIKSQFGESGFLHAPTDLRLYEYDGGVDKSLPQVIVFPRSTADVAAAVRLARQHNLAVVGRGAGTGLSGGSIARAGGMVIAFSRMNRILQLDIPNQRALVQPGVVNLDISLAAAPFGYFFAPDPSSQRACTIGGNVAENAGGPHTLAYGVTTNHVLGIEVVLPDASVLSISSDDPGYDLAGLLTGSEGTMALVTSVTVRLMRQPETVKTLLAVYGSVDEAGETVSGLAARGIIPVALEMLDGPMLRIVEAATHAGYPLDAAAVLLIEIEGLREDVEEQAAAIEHVCKLNGAREVRTAKSAAERDLLWKGRKNAFGAIGRVSPTYYVQDGVVPRTQIAATLRAIASIGEKYQLAISNIFHAGDGNMHPIIQFDPRREGELRRAQLAGEEILRFCISVGGSITGEHGVGMEKMELMSDQFSDDTLNLVKRFKALFDPQCLLNPGKVLPTGKGCLEIRQAPGTVF